MTISGCINLVSTYCGGMTSLIGCSGGCGFSSAPKTESKAASNNGDNDSVATAGAGTAGSGEGEATNGALACAPSKNCEAVINVGKRATSGEEVVLAGACRSRVARGLGA